MLQQRKKYVFSDFELERDRKKNVLKTYRPSLYWTSQGFLYLADPGEASGCSTNTSVINSLINSLSDSVIL